MIVDITVTANILIKILYAILMLLINKDNFKIKLLQASVIFYINQINAILSFFGL